MTIRFCAVTQEDCRCDCGHGPCVLQIAELAQSHPGRRQGPWVEHPDPTVIGWTTTQDGGW